METANQIAKRNFFQEYIYSFVQSKLEKNGITINGNGPGDLRVKNEEFYFRMLKFIIGHDFLAFGESFMDNQWECDDIIELLDKTRKVGKSKQKRFFNFIYGIPSILWNLQSKIQSEKNISAHYDIGNDLFNLMLDRSMNYSCAYWSKNAALDQTSTLCETLDEAQMNKMLLIGKKLHLKSGMKVLDIGCGWGYLAKFLAINFDVHVIGITLSKEQLDYATNTDTKLEALEFLRIPSLKSNGNGKVEFRLQDYRDLDEVFDRIVSVGMIEHVGNKNYSEFFDITSRCLDDDGLFLLHTIGIYHHKLPQIDPWMNKYIFPGGVIPYSFQLMDAFYGKFICEDWHNFGFDYYRTLLAWRENFYSSWPKLKHKYDERFKRMWIFYLSTCAWAFKRRKCHLWQFVLSKRGFENGCPSYR